MREQIRRILDLVQSGRLAPDDAAALLEALSARLSLSAEARPHIFGLLSAPDFGVDQVLNLLLVRVAERGAAWASAGGPAGLGGGNADLGDLGAQVAARVQEAMRRGGLGAPASRPGVTLRVEIQDEDGSTFSANLPLGLAEHAARLLPPRGLAALERAGLSAEALALLMKAGLPLGDLLHVEDEDGNTVRVTVTDGRTPFTSRPR